MKLNNPNPRHIGVKNRILWWGTIYNILINYKEWAQKNLKLRNKTFVWTSKVRNLLKLNLL